MQRMMRCTVHPIPPIELLLAEIHKPLQLVRGILVRNNLQGAKWSMWRSYSVTLAGL